MTLESREVSRTETLVITRTCYRRIDGSLWEDIVVESRPLELLELGQEIYKKAAA